MSAADDDDASPRSAPRVVRLGDRDVVFPSADLAQIEDSSALLSADDGGASLRAALARDGFVYLRGVLGAAAVLAARAAVLAHLRAQGGVLAAPGDGGAAGSVLLPACGLGCLPNMEGVNGVTHTPAVLAVLEGAPLRRCVAAALGAADAAGALATFDYTGLRAVGRRAFTGVHADSVYMSRGSPQLLTAWVPLEPAATLELGALALCRGSHAAAGLARVRATYGAFDTEAEPGFEGSGWLTCDPADVARRDAGVRWVAGDYAAGDVILFGMHTLHMSTANLTDRVRLSVDVRWQPAAHAIDSRYVGTAAEMAEKLAARKKGGAYARDDAAREGGGGGAAAVTMDDLRARWGL